VVAVSSLEPPSGIDDLVAALDGHLEQLDLSTRRLRSRRAMALSELVAVHGETALRALGGRRAAERLLADADPADDVRTLVERLLDQAGAGR